jgi:hypothetical protein
VKIYAIRLFIGGKWQTIRTYASLSEASDFASNLNTANWDIKEMSLDEAVTSERELA